MRSSGDNCESLHGIKPSPPVGAPILHLAVRSPVAQRMLGLVIWFTPLAALFFVLPSLVLGALFQSPSDFWHDVQYDYIVVGGASLPVLLPLTLVAASCFVDLMGVLLGSSIGGAGGGVLANRLTEDPDVMVLVIEAGSR